MENFEDSKKSDSAIISPDQASSLRKEILRSQKREPNLKEYMKLYLATTDMGERAKIVAEYADLAGMSDVDAAKRFKEWNEEDQRKAS